MARPVEAEPIKLHPANRHYFLFRNQPTILITSAEHYGAVINLDFDYIPYLNELQARGHNLTRIFTGTYVETAGSFGISANTLAPLGHRFIAPWARSSTPGYAGGGNKFNLAVWDNAYFSRLKDFIFQAGQRGIVVEVVLFCGYYNEALWNHSPLKSSNNINGIGTVGAGSAHSLNNGNLMGAQEQYVQKIVAELRDYDNAYYEVCNEPYFNGVTTDWQNRIISTIVQAESSFPGKHLIAQNIANGSARVSNLNPAVSILNFHYARPPDAVDENYMLHRAIAFDETGFDGSLDKTYRMQAWDFIIAGGAVFNNLDYSFTADRENGTAEYSAPGGGGPAFRTQLEVLRDFIYSFNFVLMVPNNDVIQALSAGVSGRVLAYEQAYAIYLRGGAQAQITLLIPPARYRAEWVNTKNGNIDKTEEFIHGGGNRTLASPPYSDDIALRLETSAPPAPPQPQPQPAPAPTSLVFYRGINFNGPAEQIDGHWWEGSSAPNYQYNGGSFANNNVPLNPPTDASRARMIRSSIWNGGGANVTLSAVAAGNYQVYLYVWEDNHPVTYDIYLNGQQVKKSHNSGSAGIWHKLGPWPVSVSHGGSIRINCSAGDANLSGIEVWRVGSAPLSIKSLGNNQTQLLFATEAGRTYQIQCSPDLRSWSKVTDVTASGSTVSYIDSSARAMSRCFFRVLLNP